MKTSLFIVTFFILGIIIGKQGWLNGIMDSKLSSYVLYGLMFLVGISMGIDKNAFKLIVKASWKVFFVPLAIIIGSLLGSALISLFLNKISCLDALTVGSGFGYYSLSSIMISEIRGEELGTIALLSNLIREIITLLFTPVLIWTFGTLAPIAAGGATAMDTTLPVITKFSGKEYAAIAVFSGTILTLLVPVLESLLLSL